MSDKKDERDIDEILASIDEMLSQKEPYSLQSDTRKDTVKEAAKASEDTLGLSSSVDAPELSEFNNIDIDAFLSLGMQDNQPADETKTEERKAETQVETKIEEHKIEADIVQGTDKDVVQDVDQEIVEDINFTLDETDFPDFDEPHSSNQEEKAGKQAAEISDNDDMPLSPEKPQEPVDTNTADDLVHDDVLEDDLDESELIQDEYQDDKPVAEDSTPRHRILLTEELLEPSAQEALPLWVEQAVPEEEITEAEHAPNEDEASEPQEVEPEQEKEEQTEVSKADTVEDSPEKSSDTKPSSETEEHIENAVADTAKDDASIFDLEEGIGLDTVYKLETITSAADDDLDNHTELVEVMMEEVLQDDEEQPQNSEDETEKAMEKVFLSDDEMQNMVQAVSADVAQQINDHLQTWLPGLISIAIKNHMKDLNNKG